jgi:hypothetical protein
MSELTKLDFVLEHFEDVRESPQGFRARCPVHGGRSPDDVSIALGKSWVLVHCFANCDTGQVIAAAGLTWKDLVLDEAEPVRRRPVGQRELELTADACCARLQNEREELRRLRFGRGWAAAALGMLGVGWDGSRLTLPIRDREGRLHDILRYDPFAKTGRKVLAGRNKSRMPFPAPESVDSKIIFLVEGEGTAIGLLSIGVRAVGLPGSLQGSTNPSRPGSWRGVGWHKTWADRFAESTTMILLPDCDGPGRALMGAARYDLERAGIAAHIVDLGPRNNTGMDVSVSTGSLNFKLNRQAGCELVSALFVARASVEDFILTTTTRLGSLEAGFAVVATWD